MTKNDDFEWIALAFCICESESTEIMQVFFFVIKEKLARKIKTEYFVSDGANAFYNACVAEMCGDEFLHKRWCAWHVNQNWTVNANQIQNTDPDVFIGKELQPKINKKKECKKLLFDMRAELDKSVIKTKLEHSILFFKSHVDCSTFLECFQKNYEHRATEWAYAFLSTSGGGNTNMYFEAWHQKLKYKYLNGVHQRRLDFVLSKLIQFLDDQKKKVKRKQIFGYPNKKTRRILKSHQLA